MIFIEFWWGIYKKVGGLEIYFVFVCFVFCSCSFVVICEDFVFRGKEDDL